VTYSPHPHFTALYADYTGENSLAAGLALQRVALTAGDPLLISTGSDLVLFPGDGAAPLVASFRLSTKGFIELTAVSHLGTAMAWLAEMREQGSADWRGWAERFLADCRAVRETSNESHWQDAVGVEAWRGMEGKIADLVDYGCRVSENFLTGILADESKLTFEHLRSAYLEPSGSADVPVPFNDVMVATFALTFLDIAHRMMSWLRSHALEWRKVMILICGSSGRPTAGLSWATNNMCHQLWKASGETLDPSRLLIAPHAPGLDIKRIEAGERLDMLEQGYRRLWCKTRVTAELGAKMFAGFPAFEPSIETAPVIDANTRTLREMPRLTHPDDRLTAITRLRLVMEDPRQLLSNSVSEFIIDELAAHDLDPRRVTIPGFTNASFPRIG
jgi:hypothetical protein